MRRAVNDVRSILLSLIMDFLSYVNACKMVMGL